MEAYGEYNRPQTAEGESGALERHKQHMQDMCRRYQHHYVMLEGNDGAIYEGILDGVDDDHVYLLVPIGEEDDGRGQRQLGYPYGYPSGYGYGYGYPRRFRRFRRYSLPLAFLTSLFFPFFY